MFKKIFSIALLVLCTLSIVSCKDKNNDKNNENNNKVVVESISIVESTIPSEILNTSVDSEITKIDIKVNYSDKTNKTVDLNKSMISSSDYSKLANAGTHTVTVTYENKSTTLTLVIKEEVIENNNYKATVVYPDGTPVDGGVSVQWCSSENCFLPVVVDSKGYAETELDDGTYYIHLLDVPAGYTYDPNAYTTTVNNKHIIIKLESLETINGGDGTMANPYIVDKGAYELTYDSKGAPKSKYFSFTASESGTVTISSLSADKLADKIIDPYLGFIGNVESITSFDFNKLIYDMNNSQSINFTYSFEVEAGKTYFFLVYVDNVTVDPELTGIVEEFPATFHILIK